MGKMLELIRAGKAPLSMMRRAAQGALSLSPTEAVEALVILSSHPSLGALADVTLRNWNESALLTIAADPNSPALVLTHLLRLHRQKPLIVGALRANPTLQAEANRAAEAARARAQQMAAEKARLTTENLAAVVEAPAAAPNWREARFAAALAHAEARVRNHRGTASTNGFAEPPNAVGEDAAEFSLEPSTSPVALVPAGGADEWTLEDVSPEARANESVFSLLESVRSCTAPISVLREIVQGEVAAPPRESLEMLLTFVDLGEEATRAIANWDEASLVAIAGDPDTPLALLQYLLTMPVVRPAVLAALCENPTLPLTEFDAVVRQASGEAMQTLLRSARITSSARLRTLLSDSPVLAEHSASEEEELANDYLAQHDEALRHEENTPFELTAAVEGEADALDSLLARAQRGEAGAEEGIQLSLIQKINNMKTSDRVRLALRGGREERMILIRDRSKLVALAVIDSPKVSESEMETYASMKNVQETVLRAIVGKRRFMKNYAVLRALANNPKAPIDTALPLVAHLLTRDQRALSMNKNVNETVRKTALRLFRLKNQR